MTYDAFFLPRHAAQLLTPLPDDFAWNDPKKKAPREGASGFAGLPSFFCLYSTFSAEIKALRRNKSVYQAFELINFGAGG
jgi:hypothetical protein